MRRWLPPVLALLVAGGVALSGLPALGLALRLAFVLASAPLIGAVLLLAIARTTGADWRSAGAPSRGLIWFAPLGFVTMLTATGIALPPHLAIWGAPPFVGIRAVLAVTALAWAGSRLRGGIGATFAGVTLAIYAALVTPLAADWLLPSAPGHPVSAIGMVLFLLHFAAGCIAAMPFADARRRRDFALLLVAALIGLLYLGFMDYLIVWFGNLPARVPFYLARSGWPVLAAMVVGLAGTIAAIVAGHLPLARGTAAFGLVVTAWWWIGGSVVVGLAVAAVALVVVPRTGAHAHG